MTMTNVSPYNESERKASVKITRHIVLALTNSNIGALNRLKADSSVPCVMSSEIL